MVTSANQLLTAGILQSRSDAVPGYSETGVILSGNEHLEAPTSLPDSQFVLGFTSWTVNGSGKQLLHSFQTGNASNGFRADWGSVLPAVQPAMRFPINGVSDLQSTFGDTYVAGARMHCIYSAQILGDAAVIKVAVSAGGAPWVPVIDFTSTSGALSIGYSTAGVGFSMFAAVGGNRKMSGTVYRQAIWAGTAFAGFPDVFNPAVQANFANGAAIVDPAISHAAYGLPLYEPLNTAAGMNAGTNIGTGSDFTSFGIFA